ncbi:MAG: hypothetical protein LBI58_01555, partial [Tannerellaceae bacterium]|nr:hypothetical protein [Tannerellaceae bacterium]
MRTVIILFITFLLPLSGIYSQDIEWKAGLYSFFDNAEFGGSALQTPQTMAGVHITPQGGLGIDNKHHIMAGLDMLHKYGSEKVIDAYTPLLYYRYDGRPFTFYAGSIPRRETLGGYPRMFFRDS